MTRTPMQGVPAFTRAEQRIHEDRVKAELHDAKMQSFSEIDDIVRHDCYKSGCPKCGYAQGAQHRWCQGRSRGATAEQAQCLVFGDHLHSRCPQCEFSWIERCKDDDAEMEGRGGLRRDEARCEDGSIAVIKFIPADVRWGLVKKATEDSGG